MEPTSEVAMLAVPAILWDGTYNGRLYLLCNVLGQAISCFAYVAMDLRQAKASLVAGATICGDGWIVADGAVAGFLTDTHGVTLVGQVGG